jgi:hypothetical protein
MSEQVLDLVLDSVDCPRTQRVYPRVGRLRLHRVSGGGILEYTPGKVRGGLANSIAAKRDRAHR